MPESSLRRLDVVADPKAVSLIKAHGGCLYVYADASGQRHVQTKAPNDPSMRFKRIEADGFLMYVQEGIKHPELWSVTSAASHITTSTSLGRASQGIRTWNEPSAW